MNKYHDDLALTLKKLPVSTIETTLYYLLEWSRPILSSDEFADFEKIVQKFSETDAVGLQKELQLFASQSKESWLANFWLDSYLEGRGPVQATSNFALVINPTYHEKIEKIEVKAAVFIYQLTKIYKNLTDGTFPLEQTPTGEAIDMSYYANFFKSIRLPAEKKDIFYRGEAETANNFILVLKKGHYFKLYVTDEMGELISLQQLVETIHRLLTLKLDETGYGHRIHSLSAIKRTKASELYKEIMAEKQNQENFNAIADALFVVSFNEFSDTSEAERLKNMLLNPENQFFTKTMQVLFTENGAVGFNFEHTAIDGVPTLKILSQVLEEVSKNATPFVTTKQRTAKDTELFSKLEWRISMEVAEKLVEASKAAEEVAEQFSIQHRLFESFGKETIKKMGISPDAFFHVALAMAQYQVTQNFRSVYEPVAMRAYYQGRTESARSMSVEKRLFVEAFFSKESKLNQIELKTLLKAAMSAHGARIGLCQSGNGVERHLFGLEKMAEMKQIQNGATDYFFLSEGMKHLQSNFISTTGIPQAILEAFSFAPTNHEGFGLYYGILEDNIVLDISSKVEMKEQAQALLESLCEHLVLLNELVKA